MDSTDLEVRWAEAWLNSVVNAPHSMSQRKLSSIEKRGGGLVALKGLAEQKGVHLLLIRDDHGDEIVAASKEPFQVIC